MAIICVFCGEIAQQKNKEHILPDWLIGYTGNPNRVVNIFLNIKEFVDKKDFVPFRFALDKFTLPSCYKCNNDFSTLESSAKKVMLSIMKEEPLSSKDFSTLLDWFDKVRTGLWLAQYILNKNYYGIDPNFHISLRIRRYDRLLFIYKNSNEDRCLSWQGIDGPSFNLNPSCFALNINNYYFFNASYNFLFSRRFGLPYPIKLYFHPTIKGALTGPFAVGTKRIMKPILPGFIYDRRCTELYQPMLFTPGSEGFRMNHPDYSKGDPYDQSMLMNKKQGLGKIFVYKNNDVFEYPSSKNKNWISEYTFNRFSLREISHMQSYNFHDYLLKLSPHIDFITDKKRKAHIRFERSLSKNFNDMARKKFSFMCGTCNSFMDRISRPFSWHCKKCDTVSIIDLN
jgi:hypothetical protein